MKINNDGTGALTNAADAIARTKAEPQGQAEKSRASNAGSDALKLSPEAQLLKTLSEQASGSPAIRQDVVDRMKALLDAGKVGNDADALADAIIDDLTDR
jgi:flagellar biosynthesis anti-sigma factor FlgM